MMPINNGRNYQPQLVSLPDFWTIKSIGFVYVFIGSFLTKVFNGLRFQV